MWPVQRAVQTGVHQAFPSTIALWFAEVLWMCPLPICTQCFKRCVFMRLKFYEINNFGCSRIFLSEIDILKWGTSWRRILLLAEFGLLRWFNTPVLSHHLQISTQWKRQTIYYYYFENGFGFVVQSCGPPGSHRPHFENFWSRTFSQSCFKNNLWHWHFGKFGSTYL